MTRCEVSEPTGVEWVIRWLNDHPCFGFGDGPFWRRCDFDAWSEVCAPAPRPAACEWLFESCWEVVG